MIGAHRRPARLSTLVRELIGGGLLLLAVCVALAVFG